MSTAIEATETVTTVTSLARPYESVGMDEMIARTTILSALAIGVGKLKEAHRAELYARMPRGTTLSAMDPTDELESLGSVNLSKSSKEAYVTDRDQFEEFCRLRHPSKIDRWTEFGDHDEVTKVLAEHAPHLLILHQTVTEEAQEAVLLQALTADVPGTARRLKKPALTVRPTVAAHKAALAIFAGNPVLRELAQ